MAAKYLIMNKLTSLLTAQYLLGSRYERSISIVTLICFISITIGAGSLTLVNAVMRGFQVAVHEKLQGIHADAIIQSPGQQLDTQAIDEFILKKFPQIKATSPVSSGHAIIQSSQEDLPSVVLIHGINPDKEKLVSSIEKKLIQPSSLSHAIQTNTIAIGKKIADDNNLTVGMPLALYYLDDLHGTQHISIHKANAIVGGIFQTGIDEYDASLVLTSEQFFQELFGEEGSSKLKISFAPNTNHHNTIIQLRQQLMLEVYSWKDLYPSLVSALQLERYAMFFVLLLITIVASMNIIALLFMLIQAKKTDIAILQSMGASLHTIKSIFVAIALCITASATALGILLAGIICWILNTYPCIKLPDTYYVSHLPAEWEWSMAILVFATTIIVAIIATLLPLRKIQSTTTAQVLRFEG